MLSQPLNSHPPVRAKGSNCPGPAERWTERLEAGRNAEISVDLRWFFVQSLSITVDGTLNPGSLVKSYHGYGAQAWYPQGHQTSCYCWTFIHYDNMEKHSFWSIIICTNGYLVSVMALLQATFKLRLLWNNDPMMIQGSVSSSLQLQLAVKQDPWEQALLWCPSSSYRPNFNPFIYAVPRLEVSPNCSSIVHFSPLKMDIFPPLSWKFVSVVPGNDDQGQSPGGKVRPHTLWDKVQKGVCVCIYVILCVYIWYIIILE